MHCILCHPIFNSTTPPTPPPPTTSRPAGVVPSIPCMPSVLLLLDAVRGNMHACCEVVTALLGMHQHQPRHVASVLEMLSSEVWVEAASELEQLEQLEQQSADSDPLEYEGERLDLAARVARPLQGVASDACRALWRKVSSTRGHERLGGCRVGCIFVWLSGCAWVRGCKGLQQKRDFQHPSISPHTSLLTATLAPP